MKNKTILFSITVSLFVIFAGILIYHEFRAARTSSVLQAEVSYQDSSKKQYIEILANGKTKPTHSFSASNCQVIKVDPWIFEEHVNKDQEIYLTLKKYSLKDSKDKIFYKLIDKIAKESNHSIGILNLFKLDNKYYAFIKENAGLSDEGSLYKFDLHTNKLIKVCTIDSGEIIKLKHTA